MLICGQSAGAMCWFERGITTSSGVAAMADGFGLIPGSFCVHYHRDPERRTAYLAAVADGEPPGFGADDQAGLLFEDGVVTRTISARSGAGVWQVDSGGETPVAAEDIVPAPAEAVPTDSLDDFRALSRWRTGSGIGRRR